MSGKLVVAGGGPNGPVNHLSIVSGKFRRLLKGTHTKSSASQRVVGGQSGYELGNRIGFD